MLKREDFEYELIDSGHCGRLERFDDLVLDRPCPQAEWPQTLTQFEPDVTFDSQTGWESESPLPENFNINIGPITAELRFSTNGQVGIFPEQFDNWAWIREKVCQDTTNPLKILNTFAYTGMSTLFASQPHTEVVHLDGAKSSLNWAKRNAELSGLQDHKIRWICDDVMQFLAREVRRGNKYDAIILDPPAFGRGAKKNWKIQRDLSDLMQLVGQLLTDEPLFVVLTCHAPDHFSAERFADTLQKLPGFAQSKAEPIVLEIPCKDGTPLPSSFGARIASR